MDASLMSNNVFTRKEEHKNVNDFFDQKVSSEGSEQLSIVDEKENNKIDYQNSSIDSNSMIVSDDGLTYQEVYEMLLSMLNGDMSLLSEVVKLAKIMVKQGVRIAKESQLTKRKMKKLMVKLENQSSVKNINQVKKSFFGR